AKKLIRSIFKLLFWRLDILLFLFLYQDKKRKTKSAVNPIIQVKTRHFFVLFLPMNRHLQLDKGEPKSQGSVKITI
ncbi:MAG: hypothetical protein RL708_163, partial [Bacteroidota bacterium]